MNYNVMLFNQDEWLLNIIRKCNKHSSKLKDALVTSTHGVWNNIMGKNLVTIKILELCDAMHY
jgi:hypothetical protein